MVVCHAEPVSTVVFRRSGDIEKASLMMGFCAKRDTETNSAAAAGRKNLMSFIGYLFLQKLFVEGNDILCVGDNEFACVPDGLYICLF